MKTPSDNAIHFEAKKHAWRQTQDGIVFSMVLHPNDVDATFAIAPLGTRYMVALVEVGDDDQPKLPDNPTPKEKRERRAFSSLQLSNQAGIRVGDKLFLEFLDVSNEGDAVECIYLICGITSRRELDTDEVAGKKWLTLEKDYQAWLTTMRYKDSIHAGAGGWK